MTFRTDQSGSTLPIFALSLAAIVALVGATIALGMDSRSASNLQLSADSAAISGATAFVTGDSPKAKDRLDEAEKVATALATENSDYALTALNVGAVTEDAYGQHTRIDIELKFEPVNSMAKVAGRTSNIEISRTASAIATWGFPLCVLGLNQSGTGFSMAGKVEVLAENCVMWTNSTANDSMVLAGGNVKTDGLCAAGRAPVTGGTNAEPRPKEHCNAIPDPLHDWVPPAPDSSAADESLLPDGMDWLLEEVEWILDMNGLGMDVGGYLDNPNDPGFLLAFDAAVEDINAMPKPKGMSPHGIAAGGGVFLSFDDVLQILGLVDNADPALYEDDEFFDNPTDTLAPGTYFGLDISQGHMKMSPGVYHIVDAPLLVRRRATLTGEGVTIILHGQGATFSVLDEARLTLTAPVDGITAGFALAEDRYKPLDDSEPQRSRLTGSGTIEAIGTIYLPRQKLSISGDGAGDQSSPLLQIVADNVDMKDQGALKIVFDTTKTDIPVKIKPERTARLIK